ncbi:MAG TPA: hypothetical protein VFA55_08755, partial [Candidatus Kapabacteria bacterium]|nr:hypothetical protein [Candidatus Kapabacteria bacterium]
MEELLGTEENTTEKSIRITARILSIVLSGYIYYLWSGSLRLPLDDSFSVLNWRQITLLLLDLVVVTGCIVSWKHEQLGARITLVSAVLLNVGSSLLRETGFMHANASVFLGFAVPALFLFSWYNGLDTAEEEKWGSLAHEVRWMARAYSIIIVIAILLSPLTNIIYSQWWKLYIVVGYAVCIPIAAGIILIWKYERTGSLIIMIGTLILYVVATYVRAAFTSSLHPATNFLAMNHFMICGGLFYYSSYLHRNEGVAPPVPTEPDPEAKRAAHAAKDLTLGRVFGALMIMALTDHIWIDAGNIFKNDFSIVGNTMPVLLYLVAAAGVVLSLYRGFWGVRMLLIALAIRLAWFIPRGASDGATLFIGLILGSLAVFYLLRAEDAMPGLTAEENKESHATDVRLVANALCISAVV